MNNKKLKKAKFYGFALFLFFGFCGSTLIYRSLIKETNLLKIEGKVKNIELVKGFKHYAIIIEIDKTPKKYGIYTKTLEQARLEKENIKLVVGQDYFFYIDPTVMSSNNINLGVQLIKYKNKVIYEENRKSYFIFGILFITLGIVSLYIFSILIKRNLSNH